MQVIGVPAAAAARAAEVFMTEGSFRQPPIAFEPLAAPSTDLWTDLPQLLPPPQQQQQQAEPPQQVCAARSDIAAPF